MCPVPYKILQPTCKCAKISLQFTVSGEALLYGSYLYMITDYSLDIPLFSLLHVHKLNLSHPQYEIIRTLFKQLLLLCHQVIHPLLPLYLSLYQIVTNFNFQFSPYRLIPPPNPLTQTRHILTLCIPSSLTSLQPFLPPILLSCLYHLFPLSCFFPHLLFLSVVLLFLPISLSLFFAPSVFIPQGVLSQSEANLPNYKPHLLSLLRTHTHTKLILGAPASTAPHISLSHAYTDA